MNKKSIQEVLPLGSVVTLQKGTKKVMIIGRIQVESETQKLYDYSAVLYPEGMLDPSSLYLFQHEDIDKIYHVGMQNSDEFAFRSFMEQRLEEMDLLKDAS